MGNEKHEIKMNETGSSNNKQEIKFPISPENLLRLKKDIVTFHLASHEEIVKRIANATLNSSDLHCRIVKNICFTKIPLKICQSIGQQLKKSNFDGISESTILDMFNKLEGLKLNKTIFKKDIKEIFAGTKILYDVSDSNDDLNDNPNDDLNGHIADALNLVENQKEKGNAYERLEKLTETEYRNLLGIDVEEIQNRDEATIFLHYIISALNDYIKILYDKWEINFIRKSQKEQMQNSEYIEDNGTESSEENGAVKDYRLSVRLSKEICEKIDNSGRKRAAYLSRKINIYLTFPLWQREKIIFESDFESYRNFKKFIDVNSERLYIKTKENSMQTLTDIATTGTTIEAGTSNSNQVFPAWIDIRSYNIETTDKSETKDYYVVNVSEDLFKAFTEDYCCRLEICKEHQNDQFWYKKKEEVSNSNGIKVHYYIFYIKKNERQNKQLIINYFVSLIVKKGLTNTTLKIADPPEGKEPPDFLPINTSNIPDFLSKLRKGNDSSANS